MKTNLPNFLKSFFWDTDFSNLSEKDNQQFIITRLLEKGDDRAISWLVKQYPPTIIKKALTSKTISPKTKSFWLLRYA